MVWSLLAAEWFVRPEPRDGRVRTGRCRVLCMRWWHDRKSVGSTLHAAGAVATAVATAAIAPPAVATAAFAPLTVATAITTAIATAPFAPITAISTWRVALGGP